MKISLCTLIAPRLEVFFLEEWIKHHLDLGVDEFYIYDNGLNLISKEGRFQKKRGIKAMRGWFRGPNEAELIKTAELSGMLGTSKKWDMKPNLDHFEDFSDSEIYQKLHEIEEKYTNVNVVPWEYGEQHEDKSPTSQLTGYKHCLANNKSDWWLFCDPDEYFFLKNHNNFKEFINDHPQFSCFHFFQKRFAQRKRGKPVREIFLRSSEERKSGVKALVQNPVIKDSPHSIFPAKGKVGKGERIKKHVEFYHYTCNSLREKWTKPEAKTIDKSMKKYLTKKKKIFEIGFMKTGTTSLGLAFEILGLKHMGWDEKVHEKFIKSGKMDHEPLFEIIDKYDAFEDGPWHDCDYKVLDKKYPNSKFIILERDDESWIKSLETHTSPKYKGKDPNGWFGKQWTEDREGFVKKMLEWKLSKYNEIKKYFKDRPNSLLVINICEGEGWEKLCPFLNKKVPDSPFPWTNKG